MNNSNSFIQMNKDTLLGGNVQRKFLNNEKISKLTQGKENNH